MTNEALRVEKVAGFNKLVRHKSGQFYSSIPGILLVSILSLIPLIGIVIGSVHLHECPAERYIPIYMIVAGVFALLKTALNIIYKLWRKQKGMDREAEIEAAGKTNPFDAILTLFLLIWMIAGSYWIYHIYKPSFDPHAGSEYCHSVVYWYAFVVVTIQWTFFAVTLGTICCCGCFAVLFGGS